MQTEPRQPIHVVHVTFGLEMGGQEKLLVELARYADRERFEPTFVSLGSRGVLADEIEACGASVIALEQPSGLKPALIFRLAGLFRRLRPHVIHTHDARALFYAGPAARLARIPRLIHTCHGQGVNVSRRQAHAGAALSRLVDHYVCVSQDDLEKSRQQGVPETALRTILNGIDVSRFAFQGPCEDGPAVTVARLSPEKNIGNLVKAVAFAASEAEDLRVEIAGDGPCRAELEAEAKGQGVDARVCFLGQVRDVPALLARARLFVLPSLSEGIPLTVLEAMARGLPVVATRVGGIPEAVEDGQTGLLVPSADSPALARAILHLWHDAGLARRMGEAGRRRVEDLFDIRRMVGDYERLYSGEPEISPAPRPGESVVR